MSNRDYWEVYNEELEELPEHKIKSNKIIPNKKELEIKIKLINSASNTSTITSLILMIVEEP